MWLFWRFFQRVKSTTFIYSGYFLLLVDLKKVKKVLLESSLTLCGRHDPDKNLRLGLLFMKSEPSLCVQSESMLKTIPAGYSPLVNFQN